MKAYLREQWNQDLMEEQEASRWNSIMTGSFYNPEAAKKMIKAENPDVQASDEDMLKSMEMIENQNNTPTVRSSRRRKKIIANELV